MHQVLIIGCGNIAGGFDADRPVGAQPLTHAGAYTRHRSFALTACVDRDDARRLAFSERWGVKHSASAIAGLEVEPGQFAAISICSPTGFHRDHLQAALALRPQLIFCEKPLAKTHEDAREIADLCEAAGVKLAVNYTRRWDPKVAALAEELRDGTWGRIRSVTGTYTKGIVHNGGHMVDLLHMLLGELELISVGRPSFDFWEDDPSVPALLSTATGVPVSLALGHAADYALFELQLITEGGTITMLDGGRRWAFRRPQGSDTFAGYRSLGDIEIHEGGYDEAMLRAVQNIADALDHGAPLASDFVNALAAHRLCETIRDAALNTFPQRTMQ